jgi:hypothetical protein
MKYSLLLKKEMKENGKWKFTNKQSIISLFKLVLDSDTYFQKISISIISSFIYSNILEDTNKNSKLIKKYY